MDHALTEAGPGWFGFPFYSSRDSGIYAVGQLWWYFNRFARLPNCPLQLRSGLRCRFPKLAVGSFDPTFRQFEPRFPDSLGKSNQPPVIVGLIHLGNYSISNEFFRNDIRAHFGVANGAHPKCLMDDRQQTDSDAAQSSEENRQAHITLPNPSL
ncbi:hypothetical protein ACC862_24110 [Rhizobium ruizarguesonis]